MICNLTSIWIVAKITRLNANHTVELGSTVGKEQTSKATLLSSCTFTDLRIIDNIAPIIRIAKPRSKIRETRTVINIVGKVSSRYLHDAVGIESYVVAHNTPLCRILHLEILLT